MVETVGGVISGLFTGEIGAKQGLRLEATLGGSKVPPTFGLTSSATLTDPANHLVLALQSAAWHGGDMPTFKRKIANILEMLSGNLIVPSDPDELHSAFGRIHLRRFFSHFGIDCVFDVGANQGQYASMLREKVGFAGDIISFEPIPELADELKARAAADGRWHVEQLALDREAGPATFHVMQESVFSSLRRPSADQLGIFDDGNRIARSIAVERSTVAAELARFQLQLGFRRPFLKLDTQGNDTAIVQGAGDTLGCFVGVQTELAIRHLYEDSVGFAEALADLQARGFELSAFVPNDVGHFPMLVEVDCVLYRRDAPPQGSKVL